MLVSVIPSASAQAAPGDLDATFSGDGKQRTDFGVGISRAAATAIQPDGKIVAVGTQFSSQDWDFALARYNPNGTLDTSFSGDGKLTTDFGGSDVANGVALQGDGKIVAVGGGNGDFALARYNLNGTLDSSFSGDGKQTTDFGSNGDQASEVALQANGKIIAVGGKGPAGFDDTTFALARFNPSGTLDTSFSGDGRQTTNFGETFRGDRANGVALQGDGKIVAVGNGDGGDNQDFALARYNPSGTLDTSFSGDGKLTTDFGGSEAANGVALQGDGKIVVVGVGGTSSFALARYNPNGSLDPSFSGDGKQKTDFGGGEATGVAIQGNGKIVAVGGDSNSRNFALARYNPNGTLDTSFSGDGKQTTDFGGEDKANALALQGDGKIIAVGEGGNSDFALTRYNLNGSLDTTFSGDGKQTTPFGGPYEAQGVALQSDGKMIVVGDGFFITRYNPNGSLDPSFSGDGKQTTDFDQFGQDATGVTIQDDGKIVVVGSTAGPMLSAYFAVARYNPNGTLDTSFSGDGKQTAISVGHDEAHGVAIQGDGKIVVVGSGYDVVTGDSEGVLARFNPNGSLDTSFSGDGKQTTDFGAWSGVAIQGDGKIVTVGGADGGGTGFDFAIARFNPNGTLDTSFSGDGTQTTDFGDDEGASGVALQGDGRIVTAGVGGGGTFGDFALARYDTDGSLDTSFSGDGKQTTDFGFGADDAANGIAIQGDGKIVAAGRAGGGATANDFALARYNTDGTLDPSFSDDGKRRTDFGGDDAANGVALQADGKIVAVGRGLGADGTSDFALARYLGG
ncbi:MAG TPA: hypothetical protein VN458_11490 [Solirubrobacterales bacterium]|nr:hypothetical protein [Solirubrobacterales bacterium]